MASKIALLLSLSLLLFVVAAHGCAPNCPGGQPVAPTPSYGDGHCSINVLKLRACATVLNGLAHLKVGDGPDQCCPLLKNIVDIDAAVCLCTAVKANVLGVVNLKLPIDLRVIFSHCDRTYPDGFTC